MADEKELTTAAETAEAPVEAAEAPVETAEAPVEAAEAPVEAAEPTVEAAEAPKEEAPAEEPKTAKDRVLTVIGLLLCLILAPVLIVNITMIVKSYTTPDKVPSFGGYCPFIIMTDSMVPTINSGDLVFDKVVTDPTQVQKGDVISFFDPASRNNSIVTHRVVKIVSDSDGIAFTTKGDANNTEDPVPVRPRLTARAMWSCSCRARPVWWCALPCRSCFSSVTTRFAAANMKSGSRRTPPHFSRNWRSFAPSRESEALTFVHLVNSE